MAAPSRVLRTRVVNGQSRVVLSPLDQLMPRTYTRIFLALPGTDPNIFVAAVASGLNKLCQQLPYLMGQVSQSTDRGQLELIWSESDPAVQLQMIKKRDASPDYAELKAEGFPIGFFTNEICPVGAVVDHSAPGLSAAAMVVSWTPLKSGVLLLLCVHHAVMDGTGVGELIKVLAWNVKEEIDGEEHAHILPDPTEPLTRHKRMKGSFNSEIFETKESNFDLRVLFKAHPEYTLELPTSSSGPLTPRTSKIFNFPLIKLKEIMVRLSPFTKTKPTTNTLLFALIWSSISRVRRVRLRKQHGLTSNRDGLMDLLDGGIPGPGSSKLGFAINGRKHLGTSFNKTPYLGNINLFGLTELTFEDLEKSDDESMAKTIDAIAAAITKVNSQHIAEVIDLVDQMPDVRDVRYGWNFVDGPDLAVTSWTGLDVYDLDFGERIGKVESVRVPYAEFDGLVILLPRKRNPQGEGDAVEVVVMLRKDDMEALVDDATWGAFAS